MPDYIQSIRGKIGTDLILVPSNALVVVNGEGLILLQLRSDTGRWGCPGGMMDIGETALEGARRELFEETGLEAESLTLLGVYAGGDFLATYPNGDRIAVVQLAFVARVGDAVPVACDEATELRYFRSDALPDGINDHHAVVLRHYIEVTQGKRSTPVVM